VDERGEIIKYISYLSALITANASTGVVALGHVGLELLGFSNKTNRAW
jgi:hypothetical protein